MPGHILILLQKAVRANDAKDPAETERLASQALEIEPNNPDALVLLGVARANLGKFESAQEPLEIASQDPSRAYLANYWLSVARRKLGLLEAAVKNAEAAVAINSEEPMGLEQLGYCYLEMLRFGDAELCFRSAIKAFPRKATVHGGLGLALHGQGRAREAAQAFGRAVEIQPNSVLAQSYLGQSLADEGDFRGALLCARRVVKLQPDSLDARLALVKALVAANNLSEAQQCLDVAMKAAPPTAKGLALSGQIHLILGQLAESRAAFEEALKLDPTNGQACLGFAGSHKISEDDLPFVRILEEAVRAQILPLDEISILHYALGKAYEDLERFEDAMDQFRLANLATRRLRFGDTPIDRDCGIANNGISKNVLSSEFLTRSRCEGSPSDLPIFVVGMIRSGTTLVEQILSRHPEIGGAGEQSFWQIKMPETFNSTTSELVPGKLKRLADEYCSLLRTLAPGKRHVVDKMPANCLLLPLLHLALPNARIIHVKRHPVDTCLSIYSTSNSARLEWSHDPESIMLNYREYQRMMAAAQELIPSQSLLEVKYEDLVSNPERVIREMVEFLGLGWNDACLRPQEGDRHVSTPSVWQVRQPIYKTSMEKWRNYEPWLGPFRQLLHSLDDFKSVGVQDGFAIEQLPR